MDTYCIGIDTGGTFTDAVAIRLSDKAIVAQSKTRTTHTHLARGVVAGLEQLFQGNVYPSGVRHLAVSTTLTTNAVVGDYGARVGLFVLGRVRRFKLPVTANIYIKGGHTIIGEEDAPMDMEFLVDMLYKLRGQVDSYAVCGAMSIKNPTHELVAEKAISMIDPKPVFCSHRASSHPGMEERAATACLNAKLRPLMVDFFSSIHQAMQSLGIDCPVTMTCGDGSDATMEETVERASVTMSSGPAATAQFGSFNTQASILIVDVGGTTTDICMLKNGKALLNTNGCRIGQWQTHVEAIDTHTIAGGGDSQVLCTRDGKVELGKNRVQPLALTPNLPNPDQWLHPDKDIYLLLPDIDPDADKNPSKKKDTLVLALEKYGPMTRTQLTKRTRGLGMSLDENIEQLAFEQSLIVAGFTPTDALHVLGKLEAGDCDASRKAATIYGRRLGVGAEEFCHMVVTQTVNIITKSILTYLARSVWSPGHALTMLEQESNDFFSMQFSVHMPLLGIGGAAPFFLPQVAERLNTTVHFPEHYAVGNAAGAAMIGIKNLHKKQEA